MLILLLLIQSRSRAVALAMSGFRLIKERIWLNAGHGQKGIYSGHDTGPRPETGDEHGMEGEASEESEARDSARACPSRSFSAATTIAEPPPPQAQKREAAKRFWMRRVEECREDVEAGHPSQR
jgi:hypothetical protein